MVIYKLPSIWRHLRGGWTHVPSPLFPNKLHQIKCKTFGQILDEFGYDVKLTYKEKKQTEGNLMQTKNIIIVCDKAHEKYANYLHQLVSVKDDKNEEIRGIKDGEVTSAVWLDKVYRDNKPQLPSSSLVIFIGESGTIKKETDNIPNKFYKYGMIYGWLGSKAVLKVSDRIHSGLFTIFDLKKLSDYALETQEELGMESQSNENIVLSKLDAFGESVKNVLFVKNLQYNCLVNVFYLHGFSQFIEG